MKPLVTSRTAALMTAAIIAVITACSDSDGSKLGLTGPSASAANGKQGSAGDTAKSGGGRDSSRTQTPVSKYALSVHVGTPRLGATDTLTTDPLANATVSVYEQTSTFTHSPGADTVYLNSTLVATGSSDANGNVRFPDLKGASLYLIKAAPPPGSSLGTATTFVNQAFADTIKILITLHGR
jgi:hypothetical protein